MISLDLAEVRRPFSSTPVHSELAMGFFESVFSWVMKSILDDGLLVFWLGRDFPKTV